MLYSWMEHNLLLYGMIGAGFLGILCLFVVNRFYGRTIRDLQRMDTPKGKWTKEFLNIYQMRQTREQEMNNPEAFIRTQISSGKSFGISLERWKQGVTMGALLVFLFMMTALYGTYRYEETQLMRYQYVLVGMGIFALLLMLRQFMSSVSNEERILDGLMDYMENTKSKVALSVKTEGEIEDEKMQTEELIDRVAAGIRETAADKTEFSHMLTTEEEKIMRDVIRAYLT